MSTRTERFEQLIKEEVSKIIREDVSDPRIGFVSLTKVDVSPDLKNAKIFVSILGNDKQKNDSMAGLTSATSFVRGKLGGMIRNRNVPELCFIQDDSLEKGSQVLNIISGLKNEKTSVKRNKTSNKKS